MEFIKNKHNINYQPFLFFEPLGFVVEKTKQDNNIKGPNSMLHSHHSWGSFVEKQKKSHFQSIHHSSPDRTGCFIQYSILPQTTPDRLRGEASFTVLLHGGAFPLDSFPTQFSFSLHSRHFPLGKAPTTTVWPASHPSTVTTGCPQTTTWSF